MSALGKRAGRRWRLFNEKVSGLRLPEPDADLLQDLAEGLQLRSPHEIIEEIGTFERAVHHFFRSNGATATEAEMLGGEAQDIHRVRAALGFLVPPGVTYHSTRELEPGRDIELTFAEAGAPKPVRGRVGRAREDLLDLTGLSPPVLGREGQRATALFFASGRAFRFATQVRHVEPDGSACLATHTLDIKSSSRRRYFRVRINRLALFRTDEDPPAQRREGLLVDLSAGGAGLACAFDLPVETRLFLDLCPGLYRSDLPEGASASLREMTVAGRVIRRRRPAERRLFYHIEFEDMPRPDRAQLHRLVHQLSLGQNRRRYHRIKVDRPIEIRLPEDPPHRTRLATLSDLSAGGARITVGRRLSGAEALTLRLQPARYVSPRDRREKAVPGQLELRGTVVAIRNAEHGGVIYHVDFRDIDPEPERHLLRIVRCLATARRE